MLTSPHPGATLQGGAGADTLNASQGADVLSGGGGADVFVFKAMPWSAGRIGDFTVGADRLDLSGLYTNGYKGTDPVADGYLSFHSDGAGGTRVILDVDGPGGPSSIPFHVVTLQGVSPAGLTAAAVAGGAGAAPPPPAPPPPSPAQAGLNLTSVSYGETLRGGSGADTLTAWQGPDTLIGGAGADRFVFDKLPWNAGHVTDFQPGVDVVDLRGLAGGYTGGAPGRDVTFVPDGAGGTKVMLDIDGPGGHWPYHITTLDNVQPGQVGAGDWLFA